MSTSQTLGTVGVALGIGYVGLRALGVIGGDDGSVGSSGGTIATDNMGAPGEETTIEERGRRRGLFAGVEREPVADDTSASDVNDDSGGSDLPNTSTDNMAADGEDTTLRERGERRAAFAGADTSADDSNTSATGDMEADEEETSIEERGDRRARFAGSSGGSDDDNDDYQNAVDENVGRDSGTGGVSGL
jgi:hypothetical protein